MKEVYLGATQGLQMSSSSSSSIGCTLFLNLRVDLKRASHLQPCSFPCSNNPAQLCLCFFHRISSATPSVSI